MFKSTLTALVLALGLAGCAALVNTAPIDINKKASDAKTYAPIISSMTASPTNTTTGQPLTFDVRATDPNGQALSYSWSTTSGVISASAGQMVSWVPPSTPATYPVQVVITNLDGKSTSGSLNVIVKADGNVSVASPVASASN